MSRLELVSVAILNWNGRQHLERLLPSLERLDPPGIEWEILVLDNGSSDGSVAWLRRHWPRVRVVESSVNLGFAAGNRRLVEEARGDAIAFLNNDTRVAPDWLGSLVDALSAAPADVAAVSGMVLDWDGSRLDFAQGILTFDGHAFQLDFRRPLAESRIPEAGGELLFPSGGNMIVRRPAFLEAGGFDDDYFAYLEDVDLGWRLWAAGWRVLFAPAARTYHRSMATSDRLGSANRGFLYERNAFLTAYKNYEDGLWEQWMPAVLLTFLSRLESLTAGRNPGGESLRLDPYAGSIADTVCAAGGAEDGAPQARGCADAAAGLRRYAPRELLRRALRKVRGGRAGPGGRAAPHPLLVDPQTVAHHRAAWNLLAGLDRAAEKRARLQSRRRRGDREIFARFPLHLVPTYPGDLALFESAGFRSWLPPDPPLVRRRLDEVMAWPQ